MSFHNRKIFLEISIGSMADHVGNAPTSHPWQGCILTCILVVHIWRWRRDSNSQNLPVNSRTLYSNLATPALNTKFSKNNFWQWEGDSNHRSSFPPHSFQDYRHKPDSAISLFWWRRRDSNPWNNALTGHRVSSLLHGALFGGPGKSRTYV